jgi:hypothetical protein
MLVAHIIILKKCEYVMYNLCTDNMQFRHASANYTSEYWELLRILMVTYDFKLAITKEFWDVFMIY